MHDVMANLFSDYKNSLYVPPSANVAGVDPRLVDIARLAAANFPLKVAVTPHGGRNGRKSTTNHPGGFALDFQIYDKAGKPLPNLRYGPSFRAYEAFAQTMRSVQLQKYPELTRVMRWGGYFGGRVPFDQMHIDINPAYGGATAMGSWEKGLTGHLPGAQSVPFKPGPVSLAVSALSEPGGGRGGSVEAPLPPPRMDGGGRGGAADGPMPLPAALAAPPPAETGIGAALAGLGGGLSVPPGGPADLDAPSGPLQAGLAADQSAMEMRKMHDFLLPVAENTSTSGRPMPNLFGEAATNPKVAEGLFQRLFAKPGLADIGGGIRIRAG